jgi:sugar phosphate isomerase/epimerase
MNSKLNRRAWIRQSALLAAVGIGSPAATSGALMPIKRTGGAYLKPALNAYSFLELLNENAKDSTRGIDLFGVCDFAAKLNLDAVDLTGYFFPGYPKPPEEAYLYRLKRHAHSLGLDISGTGVSNDFTLADKSARAVGVQLTKDWIEVAARLGAATVRVFSGPRSPFKDWNVAANNAKRDDVEAWMADDLRACAEHGRKFGVIVAVQNHADFLMTGADHVSLLHRVDHEWCAALVDTGKYLTADPYADIALVAPYAANWQIKETMGSSLKTPRTDYAKLVKIIRESGYRGYLPIETLSMGRKDYNPFNEVTDAVKQLRAALAGA